MVRHVAGRADFRIRFIEMSRAMEQVLVEVSGGVMLIRMNRPDKKNALTNAMYARMADALAEADARDDVKVVLVTGSADAFTAGNDLHDFLSGQTTGGDRPVVHFVKALASARKIIVAAVNGVAAGIGVTMLLHCDLAVASESARFLLPFIDLGLVPEAGSSLLFPALVGRRVANRHFLLSEPFSAAVARDYGLISEVVPDADLEGRGHAIAAELVTKPLSALLKTKELIVRGSPDLMCRIDEEIAAFAVQLESKEANHALRRFFDKGPL
jgi:enoyl-CoA hydratase/carnithine racemase